jgi:hypothetical protein
MPPWQPAQQAGRTYTTQTRSRSLALTRIFCTRDAHTMSCDATRPSSIKRSRPCPLPNPPQPCLPASPPGSPVRQRREQTPHCASDLHSLATRPARSTTRQIAFGARATQYMMHMQELQRGVQKKTRAAPCRDATRGQRGAAITLAAPHGSSASKQATANQQFTAAELMGGAHTHTRARGHTNNSRRRVTRARASCSHLWPPARLTPCR